MKKTVDYSNMSKEEYELIEAKSEELGCSHQVAAYLLALEGAIVGLANMMLCGPSTGFGGGVGDEHEHVLFDNVDIERIKSSVKNHGLDGLVV